MVCFFRLGKNQGPGKDFYIKYDTIETFTESLLPVMGRDQILAMISKASEFEQMKVRDDEFDEMDDMVRDHCYLKFWGGSANVHGKVNILVQSFISRGFLKSLRSCQISKMSSR